MSARLLEQVMPSAPGAAQSLRAHCLLIELDESPGRVNAIRRILPPQAPEAA